MGVFFCRPSAVQHKIKQIFLFFINVSLLQPVVQFIRGMSLDLSLSTYAAEGLLIPPLMKTANSRGQVLA